MNYYYFFKRIIINYYFKILNYNLFQLIDNYLICFTIQSIFQVLLIIVEILLN